MPFVTDQSPGAPAFVDLIDRAARLAGVVRLQDGFGNNLQTPALGDAATNAIAALAVGAYPELFNGGTWDRQRTPNIFKPFASTAVVAGTGVTLWTPTAGKKFRLMGWLISLSVAGQLLFGDNVVATVIARSEGLAAAAVSKATASDLGNGLLSALANNLLKLDVSASGNVAGMVWGTEE